jgi:formylmethanofuran dehydrogenase subunit C
MLVLQRKPKSFGRIDGSAIRPDRFQSLSLQEIETTPLQTDDGNVNLSEVFEVIRSGSDRTDVTLINGDCSLMDGLATQMQSGTLCVLGSVGNHLGRGMLGGTVVISEHAKSHTACGLQDGLVYVGGNCESRLAGQEPGHKSGMRGGDVFVRGNVGDRACERMRRGTVFVAGSIGPYAASQLIAGTLVVMGDLGPNWGGGMRRGTIVLGRDYEGLPTASLSEAREFELSFLPLVWRHVERLQADAHFVLATAIASLQPLGIKANGAIPAWTKIPTTRWVQRQIADLNYRGKGEVLVLRRNSSPSVS